MKNYPTNLTESQYSTILAIIGDKRKRQCSLKGVLDAIFYLLKTGCQCRMLPSDFPNWKLVHYYFNKWSRDGTLQEIHEVLRKRVRKNVAKWPLKVLVSLILRALKPPSWAVKLVAMMEAKGPPMGAKKLPISEVCKNQKPLTTCLTNRKSHPFISRVCL